MDERERWNAKYLAGGHASTKPSPWLAELHAELGAPGRALDVAGGAGRNSLWLAERGWQVTLVDVASEALAIARRRAEERGVQLDTEQRDLQEQSIPDGPWRLIVCALYLQRSLFPGFLQHLAPGGQLLVVQPTVRNLERHAKPSRRFLLEPGELRTLLSSFELMRYEEGWSSDGHHEARALAARGKP
jgi:SAM-dependent methyltransferase